MTADTRRPFRDIAAEVVAVERAHAALAEYQPTNVSGGEWAAWTGRLAAHVEGLLAVVKNLQAVADYANEKELKLR